MSAFGKLLSSLLRVSRLRPFRMYRGLRHPEPIFGANERVFMRFPPDQGGPKPSSRTVDKILREHLHVHDQSFIRERFGYLGDLRYPVFFHWGILAIPATAIRVDLLSGGDTRREYEFNLRHTPLWNNYAHSEIHVCVDRERVHKVTPKVRRDFRAHLESRGAAIERSPSQCI